MAVVCEQYRDGVPDEHVVLIPPLPGEDDAATLERKRYGAEELHGWRVEQVSETEFHAWKEYVDGDGTPDRPHRKDRYFRIVD